MLRYFVQIGYNGFDFRGWQRQKESPTVQEVMEDALSRILHERIVCIGCGRTDAKVHASHYYFHFDFFEAISFDLKFRLNKVLPPSIAVFQITPVEGYPNAQLSAISRTYNYIITRQKDPFLKELASYYPGELNVSLMNQAVKVISGYNNFANFCLCPSHNDSSICRILSAKLFSHQNGTMLRFEISADRFIQGMVRLIVQRLVDVGQGRVTPLEFEGYLALSNTPKETRRAYPEGLYLSHVAYPFNLPSCEDSFFNSFLSQGWIEM